MRRVRPRQPRLGRLLGTHPRPKQRTHAFQRHHLRAFRRCVSALVLALAAPSAADYGILAPQRGRDSLARSAGRPPTRCRRGLPCPRGAPSPPHGHRGEAAAALGACLPKVARALWCCLPARRLTDVARLGMQDLDNTTFDRVVGQGLAVLVRVDKEYPYGDSDDAWKEVGAVRLTPQTAQPATHARLGPSAPGSHACPCRLARHSAARPLQLRGTPWSAGGRQL